jgi:PEP-CTERM motif
MLTNAVKVRELVRGWLCAAGLLLSLPTVGRAELITYTFARITDTSAAIPGGTGNFISLGVSSLDGGTVAFLGLGSSGQVGIYASVIGGLVTPVVDRNTSIPVGVGNFTSFGVPSLNGGTVAFNGSGLSQQNGIYTAVVGGPVTPVADRNTPIPGGTGNFQGFSGTPSLHGGTVAFTGLVSSLPQRDGIYASVIGGPVISVADQNTPIPGGVGNFVSFLDNPSLDNGVVAFRGFDQNQIQQGIYAATLGGQVTSVVDINTPIPGGTGNFLAFRGNTSLDDGVVAFFGVDSLFRPGIYTAVIGGPVTRVADTNTPIPGDTGTFENFGSFSLSDGNVAFNDGSPRPAIYGNVEGTLARVIGPGDSLDGRTVLSATLARESQSGDQIAFVAAFTDGSSGIYVAQPQVIPEPSTLLLFGLGILGLLGYGGWRKQAGSTGARA